jgi:TM2 domain-containing membrane protein YozV
MKRLWFMVCFTALGFSVFAQGSFRSTSSRENSLWGQGGFFDIPYTRSELAAVNKELGDKPFGELTLNQLYPAWNRIGTAYQKDEYLRSTTWMSLVFPGAGQFRNGDTPAGLAFTALHLGLLAGTLVGVYAFLPGDLKFDRMDYLNNSISSIGTTWRNHSIMDYLPSFGTLLAGMVIDGGVRIWSGRSAYLGARTVIDSGKAKLEPLLGPGFMGMGLAY